MITIAVIGEAKACARHDFVLDRVGDVEVIKVSLEKIGEEGWFERVSPDLAVLCVPVEQTANLVHYLAAQGVWVVLPTPLAGRLHDAGRIKRALRRFKVQGIGWHPYRFHPGVARLKEMLDSGVLGTVQEMDVQFSGDGVWLTHSLDLCNWFLGKYKKVEVAKVGSGVQVVYGNRAVARVLEVEGDGGIVSINVNGSLGRVSLEIGHDLQVCLDACSRVLTVPENDMEEVFWGYVLDKLRQRQPFNYVTLDDSSGAVALSCEYKKQHGNNG